MLARQSAGASGAAREAMVLVGGVRLWRTCNVACVAQGDLLSGHRQCPGGRHACVSDVCTRLTPALKADW